MRFERRDGLGEDALDARKYHLANGRDFICAEPADDV
jgi:hypothetical protein